MRPLAPILLALAFVGLATGHVRAQPVAADKSGDSPPTEPASDAQDDVPGDGEGPQAPAPPAEVDAPDVSAPEVTEAEVTADWQDTEADAVGFGDESDAVGFGDESDAVGFGDGSDAVGFGDGSDTLGFGESPSGPSGVDMPPPPAQSAWAATAFVRLDSGLWVERFDDNPFAKMRFSGDLALRYKNGGWRIHLAGHIETDLAYLADRDSYDQPTLDEYQTQLIPRESFVAYGAGPAELSVGYHIVAWGEADVVSAVDVVNPRDLREPGLADLDDLRLPVLSSLLSFFTGYHRFEGMILHEANFGLRSPPFGPFSPVSALFAGSELIVGGIDLAPLLAQTDIGYTHTPKRFSAEAQQFLGRWMYKGPGLDVGLYAASVLDQTGVIRGVVPRATLQLQIPFPVDPDSIAVEVPLAADMVLDHPRYTMVGHSGAVPLSDFVFKWELATQIDRAVNVGDPADPTALGVDRARLLGGMLGASYGGIPDTNVFLEIARNWLMNRLSGPLLFPVDVVNVALRSETTFLKERLSLSLAFNMWGWLAQYGALVRGELNYTVSDGLSVGGGFITYQPTSKVGPIYGFETHDRVFVKLRYDFALL